MNMCPPPSVIELATGLFDEEKMNSCSLLRLPVGRGGVINSPRSIFLFCFFFDDESWAAAHGL